MIKVQLVSPAADPAALPGADADIPCDRSSEAAADAALCLELKICAFPGLGEQCDSVVTRFVESQEFGMALVELQGGCSVLEGEM